MRSNKLLAITFFLTISFICVAGCSDLSGTQNSSPENTLKEYIEAINNQNKEAFYDLLSSEVQEQTSKVDFYNKDYSDFRGNYQLTEYYNYSEVIEGNSADISVIIIGKYTDEFAEKYNIKQYFEEHVRFIMLLEDGEWKINILAIGG